MLLHYADKLQHIGQLLSPISTPSDGYGNQTELTTPVTINCFAFKKEYIRQHRHSELTQVQGWSAFLPISYYQVPENSFLVNVVTKQGQQVVSRARITKIEVFSNPLDGIQVVEAHLSFN